MSKGTWACGDCGAVYPDSTWYCTREALDSINLAGYSTDAPIYTALVTAWDFNPIGDDYYRKRMRNHPTIARRYERAA